MKYFLKKKQTNKKPKKQKTLAQNNYNFGMYF